MSYFFVTPVGRPTKSSIFQLVRNMGGKRVSRLSGSSLVLAFFLPGLRHLLRVLPKVCIVLNTRGAPIASPLKKELDIPSSPCVAALLRVGWRNRLSPRRAQSIEHAASYPHNLNYAPLSSNG